MLAFFGGLITTLLEWWFGKKQADVAAAHDASVAAAQQSKDALQGESDALKKVDADAIAVDGAGSVPIANDPANRNR